MENITNKTLFITMIIVGLVIALMIIPLYPKSYVSTRNLGATAFFDDNISFPRNNYINLKTNYPVTTFRTSNTRTITTTSEIPVTETYYYTTEQPSLPDESNYYPYSGYVPPGCESGNFDYSPITNEPCG